MTNLLERVTAQRPGTWETDLSANIIAQMRVIGAPLVSPDGRYVAYVQDYNQRADIWVVPVGGGNALLATADAPCTPAFTGGAGAGFAWTPDSASLIYTTPDDGKLRRVSREGGRARKISEGEGGNASPSVAPNGAFVAYLVDRGDVDEQMFIAVRDLDTKTPTTRRITPDGIFAIDPQVSPDGTRVACVLSDTYGRWSHDAQIAVIDLASGAIHVLTPTDEVVNNSPRWSPDGATLAFVSDRSGYANIWTVAAEGGEPRQLAPRISSTESRAGLPMGGGLPTHATRMRTSRSWLRRSPRGRANGSPPSAEYTTASRGRAMASGLSPSIRARNARRTS